MSSARHGRIGQIALLAAPVVAIVAVRWLAGGLTPAPASQPAPDPTQASAGAAVAQLTPAQKRALEWIRGASASHRLSSPLDTSTWDVLPESVPTPRPELPSAPIQPGLKPEVEALRVTAVLGRPDAALVAINGKVYRVGDEAVPGWKIASINIENQSVRISDSEGTEVLVTRTSAAFDR